MNPAIEQNDDWSFCVSSLEEVSRSFSKPIQLLPEEQRRALTCGYLLCRVADTIEDSDDLQEEKRDDLFQLFHRVLRGRADARLVAELFGDAQASEAEKRLLEGFPSVMRVFSSQRLKVQQMTIAWVSEMADGMQIYCRRSEGRDFTAVLSLVDLERYCYYVAGTVGHLITDLFADLIDQPSVESELRKNAESFGLGLQMVNMVKDITDDFERGVSYMPRQLCLDEGFEPQELLKPENRQAAFRVVHKVIERASQHLNAAMDYVLALPAQQQGFRLFCALPLFMAVETLKLARNHPAVFEADKKVKISREMVGTIIAECGRVCGDDQALLAAFRSHQESETEQGVQALGTC